MKDIKFHYLMFIVGLALVLFSLLSGVTWQGASVTIHLVARIGVGVVGALLALCGAYIEFKPSSRMARATGKENTPHQAESFFFTSDDKVAESFPTITANAKEVWVLARTAVNLLNFFEPYIVELGKRGCKVNFLFTDPTCAATRYLYGGETAIYHENMTLTARHIASISKSVPNGQFEVRVMPHAPTLSIVVAEHDESTKNSMSVVLYFIHHVYGRARPMFRIYSGDRWYSVFRSELSTLWEKAKPWDQLSSSKIGKE